MSAPIPLFFGQCGCCNPCEDITIQWMMHNARKNMPGWLPWNDGDTSDGRAFNQAADFLVTPDTISYLTRTETLKYAGVIYCTRVINIDPLSCLPSGTSGSGAAPANLAGEGNVSKQPLFGGFNDWWGVTNNASQTLNGTSAYFSGNGDSPGNLWEYQADLSNPFTFANLIDALAVMLTASLDLYTAIYPFTYNTCDLTDYPFYPVNDVRDTIPPGYSYLQIRRAEILGVGWQSGFQWNLDSGAAFNAALAGYFPGLDGTISFTQVDATGLRLASHIALPGGGQLENQVLQLDNVNGPARFYYVDNDLVTFKCENWAAPALISTDVVDVYLASSLPVVSVKALTPDGQLDNTEVSLNFYTYCPAEFPAFSDNKSVTQPAPISFTFRGSDAITLGVAPYTYQWQTGVDGTTFVNLNEGGVYSGVTTNTLHISDTTSLSQAPNGGTFYRCIVISADGGKIASDYVFLQVL